MAASMESENVLSAVFLSNCSLYTAYTAGEYRFDWFLLHCLVPSVMVRKYIFCSFEKRL